MSLKIIEIKSAGDLQHERIILSVNGDLDLGENILLCVRQEDDVPLSGECKAFWFRDVSVKDGDLIVIYTKMGVRKEKENSKGTTSYFEYWGYKGTIWDSSRAAVVLKTGSFTSKVVESSVAGDDSE